MDGLENNLIVQDQGAQLAEATALYAGAVDDGIDAVDGISNATVAIEMALVNINDQENSEGIRVALESAMFTLESHLRTINAEHLLKKKVHPAMESDDSAGYYHTLVALESILEDLTIANEGLVNTLWRSFSDWYQYGEKVIKEQKLEAENLLRLISELPKSPRHGDIVFRNADNICFGGKLDGKALLQGYKNMLTLESKFEDDFRKMFVDYLHTVGKTYAATNNKFDKRVESGYVTWWAVAWVFALGLYGGAGYGIYRVWLHRKANNDPARIEAMNELFEEVRSSFADFVSDYRKTFGRLRFSGERSIVLLTTKEGDFDGVDIRKESTVNSSTRADVLSLDEMIAILHVLIEGTDTFTHRDAAKDRVGHLLETETAKMLESGKHQQNAAVKRAAKRVENFGLKLYWRPVTALGKVHLSVNRTLLAVVKANIDAY